jgi:hypothetical protein
MGLTNQNELHPWHIMRRTNSTETKHSGENYEFLKNGELLEKWGTTGRTEPTDNL